MNTEISHNEVVIAAHRTMAKIILNQLSSYDQDDLYTDDGLHVDGVAVWWESTGWRLYAYASDHEVTSTLTDFEGGTLVDYHTGETIGAATMQQFAESYLAAENDGGRGVIDVDGRSCYVV